MVETGPAFKGSKKEVVGGMASGLVGMHLKAHLGLSCLL